MLLIYTHNITPRFTYVTRHLFVHILGIEISYSSTVEDFIRHKGPKITYTRQPLQNEFFIRSHELLFEQGIDEVAVQVEPWDELPCYFRTNERSNLPFDIFAAAFYLISRYEEYLPHVKDIHGRFSPRESLAFQHNFLKMPIVDLWAYKMLGLLQDRFPDLQASPGTYSFTPVIDVTTSHCYAHRGVLRSFGGMMLDLSKFRLKRVWERIKVWFNPSSDPYDNYDFLISLHKKYPVSALFFFQFAEYSTYDKNVSTNNNHFRYLIKSVADYGIVSLAASYTASEKLEVLKEEKKRLSDVLNRPVKYARLRYNRVDIPHSYRHLIEAEFTEDYTMGYTHEIGFRAGTCTPFFFYDIAMESAQPIRIFPFAMHDYALLRYDSTEGLWKDLDGLYREIKKVNGRFIAIFSNELLGGSQKINWLELYESFLKRYHA